MKFKNLLLMLTVFASTLVTAQDADECKRYQAIAGNAYKAKEYKKVTRSYVIAHKECEGLDMVFYNPFVYSVKRSMKSAESEETEKAYLDTLIQVYEWAQEEHGDQPDWKSYQAYSYLKQGKPGNMKKADRAYQIGIHHDAEEVNKGFLKQYYANLYNLWVQAKDKDKKAGYKKRLISEYFKLSDYASKGDMGASTIDFLSKYMSRVVRNCEDLLPEISLFMDELPQEKATKKSTVKNFMSLLEDKGCTGSDEYAMLVDTIIAIDPSTDAVLAKAKLQMAQGDVNDAIQTFEKAKNMSSDADQKSDIELEIANAYYRAGRFKSAHNAGLGVSGKNSSKGYSIAAKSVNAMMNQCGVSTFDRKANNYYAVELAQKAGNNALVQRFKKQCPTSSDIFNQDMEEGDEVTLSCWGKTFKVKAY